MTQDEKKLLLRDLCARLPYNIKCLDIERNTLINVDDLYNYLHSGWYFDLKPYLRPLSDITKDERLEVEMIFEKWFEKNACKVDGEGYIEVLANYDVSGIEPGFCSDYVDWLDSHYFDHRGLIPRNLALKAPEGMYKTE